MFKLITTEVRAAGGLPETKVRKYRNDTTGTEITTYLLFTDRGGGQWWTFEDLFQLPFIRQLAAKKIVDLYGHGLTITDVKGYTRQIKTALRADKDPERYDRAMQKVLELEQLTDAMADPVKQCIGLGTLYVLLNDERPDAYVQAEQNVKMSALALDLDLQSFFLNWWTGVMRSSGKLLQGLSRIASTLPQ
jgi:hypothetical protein